MKLGLGFLKRAVPKICDGVDYSGAGQYMLRGGVLTGVVDGKKGTLSAWVRMDGGDGVIQRIICSTTGVASRVIFERTGGNKFKMQCRNAAGAVILDIATAANFTTNAAWRHVLASWDLATAGARHLYIDGASDLVVTTFTNDTIAYATGISNWAVAQDGTGSDLFNGCLAEAFLDTLNYTDLSVSANRAKFRTPAGKPAFLGADGSRPFGAVPPLYLSLTKGAAAATFATNKGGGGNFAITGAPVVSSTSPSD